MLYHDPGSSDKTLVAVNSLSMYIP